MKTTGHIEYVQRSVEGFYLVTLGIEGSEELARWIEKEQEQKLSIELKRYKEPRSLTANNYFWKLCELIAQKMGSTQDEIHDLMLYRYGVRSDLRCDKKVIPALEQTFDIVMIIEDYGEEVDVRCFVGSRFYDTAEMARLIDGAVTDAKEQGCELMNPEEIDRLVAEWKGAKNERH